MVFRFIERSTNQIGNTAPITIDKITATIFISATSFDLLTRKITQTKKKNGGMKKLETNRANCFLFTSDKYFFFLRISFGKVLQDIFNFAV